MLALMGVPRSSAPEIRPISLRFVEPALETAFQDAYFRENLPYIRLAHVMGIVLWAAFGILADIVIEGEHGMDLLLRFGIAVPVLVVSLAATYARRFQPMWREWLSGVLLANAVIWSTHRALVPSAPPDWGYAGLMVILAFCYILSRLPVAYASVLGVVMIAYHNVVSFEIVHGIAPTTCYGTRCRPPSSTVFRRAIRSPRPRRSPTGSTTSPCSSPIWSGSRSTRRASSRASSWWPSTTCSRASTSWPIGSATRDQDGRRLVHGRRRRAGSASGPRGGRGRDGDRDHRMPRRRLLADG
jgi:hypothetical protein